MISASHNPFYDNGIKLLNGNGQKIEAEIEERIEAYIDGEIEELPLARKEDIGRTVDFASGRNRYIGYLISIPSRDFKNVKVGLDCANGSSSAIAKSVFEALQAKTYVINNQPDGTNINTNCGSTHIEVLQKYVVDNGLDIGFAYDGDADRCKRTSFTARTWAHAMCESILKRRLRLRLALFFQTSSFGSKSVMYSSVRWPNARAARPA